MIEQLENEKRCTGQCAAMLPLSAFGLRAASTDGRESRCRACRSIAKAGAVLPLPWSDAENGIIREFYPAGGARACEALLVRRAMQSIQQQARKLGVAFQRPVADEDLQGTPADLAPATPIPTHDHHAEAFREWQAIDRRIAGIPAANGPTYSMGVAA